MFAKHLGSEKSPALITRPSVAARILHNLLQSLAMFFFHGDDATIMDTLTTQPLASDTTCPRPSRLRGTAGVPPVDCPAYIVAVPARQGGGGAQK